MIDPTRTRRRGQLYRLTFLLLWRNLPGMRTPELLFRKPTKQVVERLTKTARIPHRVISNNKGWSRRFTLVNADLICVHLRKSAVENRHTKQNPVVARPTHAANRV